MSTPPRRRRDPDASGSGAGGGGWLPTIAIGLGVVIAGLGIGALVAVFMQRSTTAKLPPVALVTSTPGRPVPPARIPAPGRLRERPFRNGFHLARAPVIASKIRRPRNRTA